jgi:hypothetical protein
LLRGVGFSEGQVTERLLPGLKEVSLRLPEATVETGGKIFYAIKNMYQ